MSQTPLRPEYFVTRTNGIMVPLLAVDELPHHIVIEDVSRVMSPLDIAGMTCVGQSSIRHRHYIVQNEPRLAATSKNVGVDALKAKYFITRESGNMVPLVAMDEMPEHFIIDGIDRLVSPFEIAGMTCVGVADARENSHVVGDVNNPSLAYFAEQTNAGRPSGQSEKSAITLFSRKESQPRETVQSSDSPLLHFDQTDELTPPESNDGHLSVGSSSRHEQIPQAHVYSEPNANQSVQTVSPDEDAAKVSKAMAIRSQIKEYCSYWLRHGECDYQQQGCLYKHQMPTDKETLTRLGLRDIPRWYRELHSLGSHLAAGGSGAAFSDQSMKSRAATEARPEDRPDKFMEDWRAGQSRGQRALYTAPRRNRGNVYNPRESRRAAPFPLKDGPLRSNETLQYRQNVEALQKLQAHAKVYRDHQKNFGLVTIDDDRRSVSTFVSDIEAEVLREDAQRKAKADEEYARAIEAEKKKKAAAADAASTTASTTGLTTVPDSAADATASTNAGTAAGNTASKAVSASSTPPVAKAKAGKKNHRTSQAGRQKQQHKRTGGNRGPAKKGDSK